MFIFGTHACLAALGNPMRKIKRVLISKQTQDELELKFKNLQLVDNRKIESLLPAGSVHQGIAIECEMLAQPDLADFISNVSDKKAQAVIILDQVTDPHNVGAILRTAAAFNIAAIITTSRNAPPESGIMAKSASGAVDIVPYIMVGNLVQAIGQLKKAGYWIYGFDKNATKEISATEFSTKTALVLGAEGKGLRRLTAEHCDIMLNIPMSEKMESLNVSNAAAIAMYELFKNVPRQSI